MTNIFLRFISREKFSLRTLPPNEFTYKSLIHCSPKYGESFSLAANISEEGDLTCIRTGSTTFTISTGDSLSSSNSKNENQRIIKGIWKQSITLPAHSLQSTVTCFRIKYHLRRNLLGWTGVVYCSLCKCCLLICGVNASYLFLTDLSLPAAPFSGLKQFEKTHSLHVSRLRAGIGPAEVRVGSLRWLGPLRWWILFLYFYWAGTH